MSVCKFFLQGNCRFGENCKFEHQYRDGHQQHPSIIRQQTFNPANINAFGTPVDTAALVHSVINDMNAIEQGKQWLLSCFAPFKEKSLFPGFEDHSFEEIRYGYYNAKTNGTVDNYLQQLNVLLQEAMMRVKSLQNPTQEAIAILRNIYDKNVQPTPNSFTTAPPPTLGGNNQNSILNNTAINTNVFPQPTNVGNTNIFNMNNQQQQNSNAQSIFATANQALFPGTQQSGTQNIFSNTQQTPFVQSFQQENTSGFPQTQGGFVNNPFSSNANRAPFSSSIQNNSSFIPQQPQTGTSIFNTPSSVSSNSPLVAQQNINTTFNSQVPQNSLFNNSVGPFSGFQAQSQQLAPQAPANLPPPTNVLNAVPFSEQPVIAVNESVYSKPEELSESDIQSYQADAFEFGKIPEKPPHISMC